MPTISTYNGTLAYIVSVGVANMAFRVMLLNASGTFVATHTSLASVSTNEVSGNGWTSGGVELTGEIVNIVSTNGAMIDANDVTSTASGGDIGPASFAVIYDDLEVNDRPLWHIAFDSPRTANAGTQFNLPLSANGIARFTVT